MKRIYTLSIIIFFTCLIFATDNDNDTTISKTHPFAYNGYQGGMMFHIGYVQSRQFQFNDLQGNPIGEPMQLKGLETGIGGALRVGFGKYLRVGIEGYVSTHKYGPNANSAKVGWGGLLLDSHWHINKWTIFAGGVVGGGSYSHISLINKENINPEDNKDDDFVIENQNILYRNYPFATIVPFVGAEYSLTKRISLVAKIDYMLNLSNWEDDYMHGPRFFLGIMFGR